MNSIHVRRHAINLMPESARVIIRPFIPFNARLVANVIGRALALSEEAAVQELEFIRRQFESRHADIEPILLAHYKKVLPHVVTPHPLSLARELLIGALFSGEYSMESAALFNPSIVPHPDQGDLPAGGLRFVMSLRAIGEGHISSIEFRSGVIDPEGGITLDPVSRFVAVPEIVSNPSYRKKQFIIKLHEMGFTDRHASGVMDPLPDNFTRTELEQSVATVRNAATTDTLNFKRTLDCIQWLADSNYELQFSSKLTMSERIIFPVSANESNGIEDARFVRFTEDDGTVLYCATYTAYNGRAILPQLIETPDFLNFRVLTLNGPAVQNKGMALFPRRIGGRYAMLSRQDGENIFLMYSEDLHFWLTRETLLKPTYGWEFVQLGNCGSPIETEAGWLVITHGVGPMRKYCIGAALLDLNDPTRVLGRLRTPLLVSEGEEREGYVPNVVYTCGALLHGRDLILPYALNDKVTTFSSVPLDELLAALRPQNSD